MKLRIAAVAAIAAAIAIPALAIPVLAASGAAQSGTRGASPFRAPAGLLAGFDTGLYRIEASGAATPLWLDGEVRKIVRAGSGPEAAWFLLTSRGIVRSADLGVFEERSAGLPVKTYKRYAEGRKSFLTEVMDLKDLEVDPQDPATLVTCTKDAVYLTRDGGLSWASLGNPSPTTGLKAVAVGAAPSPAGSPAGERRVWASHPIKGLFSRPLEGRSKAWVPVEAGLATIEGTTSVEELADAVLAAGAPGGSTSLWASNSFLPRLYRWDPASASFLAAFAGAGDFGCVESIDVIGPASVRFVSEGEILRLEGDGPPERDGPAMAALAAAAGAQSRSQLCCLSWDEGGRQAGLSELWLVSFVDRKPYRAAAENKNGLYLATGFVVHAASRDKYDKLMDSRRLDSVVVDLKDDFGRLRFEPRDPALRAVGKVTSPLEVESFVAAWKAKGRWLVARIPVFKDEVAYAHGGGKWAAWDAEAKAPWRGYNLVKAPPAAAAPLAGSPAAPGAALAPAPGGAAAPVPAAPALVREYIKEYWVDPYCEEVWAYNVAIANEIVSRGFDEVQFDYIRFPTDGENVDRITYRWRDKGMDKESAIASFLRFARENVRAPVSVDIYGANGWYRSGVRTGQDVELMAKYVDVICPMLYPSHFEQTFLAQAPAELRPYRIYRLGTLRTTYIARKKVAVRPYVQAFYLNVSYDRSYYDLDYVRREVEGVRDATNLGMTFWNNAGRYDDVPVLDLAPDGKIATRRAPEEAPASVLD
ncbi:MAG TPA: putative glycoside hydrolase [Spirochaetales bacterium]|nr:putative glycoside hydrolase [Spirochaetales bacterium]HRY55342.1 putative glycoside hydrolase [Spirochaetia bacterium]